MGVVLLLPVYNEETYLPRLLPLLEQVADLIVAVDDGSADRSPEILRRWASDRARVELVLRPSNGGKSRAVLEGLQRLEELRRQGRLGADDALVLLDADGQHPVECIPALCRALAERDLDMLVAARDLSIYPLHKIWGNRLLTWQARLLTGLAYHDTQCGLRALRLDRATQLLGVLSGVAYTCEQEMCVALPLLGWRVANDFPIRPAHRRSNSTLADAVRILAAGWRAWRRFRRSSARVAEPAREKEPAASVP
jgi:dolichol-phosphate mannosyltransferase